VDEDRLADGSPRLREAISRFQADNRMVVSGVVDFPTYERALRNFVTLGADGKLVRIGWPTTAATPAPATALARRLDMQIENIKVDRSRFEVGEQIFLSATLSRSAFLSCYLADARGTVTRLLPNSSNRSMWVTANQAVRIPDWMSPNPGFIMDAGSPGIEGAACFATDDEGLDKLPEPMRGPSLKPIPGLTSLQDVDSAYAKAWGPTGYTANAVRWQVEPRRNGTAAK
jgi:hypothetical protein